MIGKIGNYIQLFFTAAGKWRYARIGAAGLMVLSVLIPLLNILLMSGAYALSPEAKKLVGAPNSNLTSKLQYDSQEKAWLFNNIEKPASKSQVEELLLRAQVSSGSTSSTTLYSATVYEDASKGIRYTDNATQLSFAIKPQFKKAAGKLVDNRLIYPMADNAKAVYTIKANGFKEDIILDTAIADELSYSYALDLPASLTAKIQPDGSVGIYSANPLLYSAQAAQDTDAEKLRTARESAPKDYLAFGLPAPIIIDGKGARVPGSFSLAGDVLTVHARGLLKLSYPLTIDPSVVITSSSDFATGNAEGMIDYATPDQITRSALSGGTAGSWAATTSFSSAIGSNRTQMGFTIHNGYMYIVGGAGGSGAYQQNSAYAPINSNGTVGTWTATTSLPTPLAGHELVAYNGYVYVTGGMTSGNNDFVSTTYYAPINPNGSLGAWVSGPAFTGVRAAHSSVAANGYLYVSGGEFDWWAQNQSSTYYTKINADGSLGAWAATTSLPTGRGNLAMVALNDSIYFIGGNTTGGTTYNTVLRATINTDGSLSAMASDTVMPTGRSPTSDGAFIHNGYLYVLGGLVSGATTRDVLYAPIGANGVVGSWAATTQFTAPNRAWHSTGAYNGYMYVVGGDSGWQPGGSVLYDGVQYSKITDAGTAGTYTTSGSTLGATRRGAATVLYGSYLYAIGGDNGSGATNTVYRALVASAGTVGSFSTTTALPANRTYAAAVAYNNKLYVIGGCSSAWTSCTTAGNNATTVYSATIDTTNGNLSAWTTESGTITTARYGLSAAVYNGYLYVMGGLNGSTFNNTIDYHAIAANGAITGAWSNTTRTLPTAIAYTTSTIYGGTLYVAGGCSAGPTSCSTSQNTVLHAAIGASGNLAGSGALTTTTAFTTARGDHGMTAMNGRLYIAGGRTNTTYYNDTQSAPINTDGTIGTWGTSSGSTLATARAGVGMDTANGMLYVVGGYNGGTYYNNVQVAAVNNGGGGNSTAWTEDATGPFTTARRLHQTVIYNGYIYILGGQNSASTALNDVQYAPLSPDGSVGSWAATSSFANARVTLGAAAMNGYMYILGGRGGSYYKDIQYAKINTDGSLGAWAAAGANVSNAGQGACLVAYNGYLYSLGGWDNVNDHDTTRYATQNSDGTIGAWQNGTSFTDGRSNGQCLAYNGYLYVIGGEDASGKNDVQYAAINSGNGSIGAWAYTTSFHLGRANHGAVAYNGFLYIIGGVDASGTDVARGDIQFAPINGNGTVGQWQGQRIVSNDFRHVSATAHNGYMYVTGEDVGGSLLATTRYTALNTITRKGTYSKLVDIGMLGRVINITYNGVLPGGALQINYRTAETNGVFGELKNVQFPGFGDACVGAFGNARYVWLSAILDDATNGTFGDSNRAHITDISVVYSPVRPDVDYRLNGGKTLITGTLSPLDTCG